MSWCRKASRRENYCKIPEGPSLSHGQWTSRQQLGQQGDGLCQQTCPLLGRCLPGKTEIQPTESYSSCFLGLPLCFQLRVAQPIPSLAPFPVMILHSGMEEWKGQFQRKEVINHKPFLSVILWMGVSCVHGVCMCAILTKFGFSAPRLPAESCFDQGLSLSCWSVQEIPSKWSFSRRASININSSAPSSWYGGSHAVLWLINYCC